MYKYAFFIAIVFVFLCSCEEELEDFRVTNVANSIIVSGEISTTTGPFIIRLNRPTAYSPYDVREFTGIPVKKAIVSVTDNVGKEISFAEIFDGVYQTTTLGFKGVVGNSYVLHIKTNDGKIIESKPSKILDLANVSDYSFAYHQDNEKIENSYFDISTKIKDNAATPNNYLLKRQDYIQFLTTCPPPPPPPANPPPCYIKCWKAPLNTTPMLFDDFLINGKTIEKIITRIPLEDIGDFAIDMKVYNLEKDHYDYWKRLEDQRILNGSIFDKIPSQITGNLTCTNDASVEVLGYFGAVSVVKKRLRVSRYNQLTDANIAKLIEYVNRKEIRYPKYVLSNCSEAAFVPYNLGFDIPPFVE
jgi:Domain of unknown function (DUF4249)